MGLLAVLCLGFILLLSELRARKRLALGPSDFSSLWIRFQKKKMPKGAVWPPLGFAVMATFNFALWEFFIKLLLNREVPVWGLLLGVFVMTFLLSFRYHKQKVNRLIWTQEEVLLGALSWIMVTSSWIGLILIFWVWIRSRHLPFEFFGLNIKS